MITSTRGFAEKILWFAENILWTLCCMSKIKVKLKVNYIGLKSKFYVIFLSVLFRNVIKFPFLRF